MVRRMTLDHVTVVRFHLPLPRKGENMDKKKWQSEAIEMLKQYPKTKFMTDEFREWSYLNGLPKPEDERNWGGVMTSKK
jgi:hypothetical protein